MKLFFIPTRYFIYRRQIIFPSFLPLNYPDKLLRNSCRIKDHLCGFSFRTRNSVIPRWVLSIIHMPRHSPVEAPAEIQPVGIKTMLVIVWPDHGFGHFSVMCRSNVLSVATVPHYSIKTVQKRLYL